MQAALAQIADGPPPGRGRKAGGPLILLASVLAHGLVLGGLVAGVRVMPPMVEPPTLSLELLRQETPPPPPPTRLAEPSAAAAPRSAAPVPPRSAAPPAVAPAQPAAPVSATAPPGFKARGLTGGGDALREATRQGIGCRNADELALTKAQKAACAEKLGEKNKNRPAMYAVIDPDKKAAFDGDCKKDDDWCLYRAGKGPYPGLFALGRKKKIKGWD